MDMRLPALNSEMARWRTALLAIALVSVLLVAGVLGSGATATAVTARASAHVSKKQARRAERACLRLKRERRRAAARRKAARRHKAARASSAAHKAKPRKAKGDPCAGSARHAARRGVKTVKHPTAPVTSTPPATGETGASEAMPTGNIPGWTQVFADDFGGSSLNPANWYTYASSQPGGDPGAWLLPSHVTVSGGDLVVSAYRDSADGGLWTSGGVTSEPGLVRTYGKYLVRFRFPAGHGIAHGLMLLPADSPGPPEIDFSEDNGEGRNIDTATLHYGPGEEDERVTVATDLTQWHTLGVEWTKEKLVYTLDGHEWGRMEGNKVPSTPMALDIQTQAWMCGVNAWEACPDSNTPATTDLYVDWVVAYAPSG
jgi:Glycosyl hydrolases family 16